MIAFAYQRYVEEKLAVQDGGVLLGYLQLYRFLVRTGIEPLVYDQVREVYQALLKQVHLP